MPTIPSYHRCSTKEEAVNELDAGNWIEVYKLDSQESWVMTITIEDFTLSVFIEYCPFCGKKL